MESTKVQSSQANSGCMLSGARRVHPVIVSWSNSDGYIPVVVITAKPPLAEGLAPEFMPGDGLRSGPQRPPGVGADRMVDTGGTLVHWQKPHVAPRPVEDRGRKDEAPSRNVFVCVPMSCRGPTPFAPRTRPRLDRKHGLDRTRNVWFPGRRTSGTVRG